MYVYRYIIMTAINIIRKNHMNKSTTLNIHMYTQLLVLLISCTLKIAMGKSKIEIHLLNSVVRAIKGSLYSVQLTS